MSTDLVIREAVATDVEPLVELATNTFRDAYRHLDEPEDIEAYVSGAFTPETLASILDDRDSVLLVALSGSGEYLGYAHVAHSTPPSCVVGPKPVELVRLYLRQSVIGKGYGAALMRAVLATAKESGGKTLWLGVYSRNEHARSFYRRCGFVDVGTEDFVFGRQIYADPVMSVSLTDGPQLRDREDSPRDA